MRTAVAIIAMQILMAIGIGLAGVIVPGVVIR